LQSSTKPLTGGLARLIGLYHPVDALFLAVEAVAVPLGDDDRIGSSTGLAMVVSALIGAKRRDLGEG
jgi:hypothetical protein